MIENMKVEFGRTSDIDSWMRLVRKVSWNFPGLETEQSICLLYTSDAADEL